MFKINERLVKGIIYLLIALLFYLNLFPALGVTINIGNNTKFKLSVINESVETVSNDTSAVVDVSFTATPTPIVCLLYTSPSPRD